MTAVLSDARLGELADRLVGVPGIVAVALGGSRARGDHTAGSDVDLGLYYRPPLDVDGLAALAREVAGPGAEVTVPGAWGPWVDGGAWLRIDGTAVDWIYRDVDRVHASWAAAQQGQVTFHAQVGHPLGWPESGYAGELALGRLLADPTGELSALREQLSTYPPALAEAMVVGCLWEADFCVAIARKATPRADTAYVAGCLSRSLELCAQALHGWAGRWLVNEKGAVPAAGRLDGAPPHFAVRAREVLGRLGTSQAELDAAVDAAAQLVAAVARACEAPAAGQDRSGASSTHLRGGGR